MRAPRGRTWSTPLTGLLPAFGSRPDPDARARQTCSVSRCRVRMTRPRVGSGAEWGTWTRSALLTLTSAYVRTLAYEQLIVSQVEEKFVSLPPLVEPAAELTVDEVR